MSKQAIANVKKCLKNKETTLDIGNCGLRDIHFAKGVYGNTSMLHDLLCQCTHIHTLILSNSWYGWNPETRQYSHQQSQNTGDKNVLNSHPPALHMLTQLSGLICGGDDFARWTIANMGFVSTMTQLKKLFLQNNQITQITGLEKLEQLQNLDLANNQIIEITGLEKLAQLQNLDLKNNQITQITGLEKLAQLQNLDLANNQITQITGLEKLKQLQNLYLSFNQITQVKGLEKLAQLQNLYLSNNQITQITGLGQLTQLKYLGLNDNQIEALPLAFVEETSLSLSFKREYSGFYNTILLFGNPITSPPPEILAEGIDAILEALRGEQSPLNECKLVFVGEGGVGKTSLMKRLAFDEFNEKEPQTHGINKVAWNGLFTDDSKPIKVNLWDFGGQHIQHSLHQFFFTERVVYVVVLDPRNDERAYYWLDQIEKLGGDSDVIIVYNWRQEEDKKTDYLKNFYQLRQKYPKLPDPVLLSCANREGLDTFQEVLTKAILANEGLSTTYEKKWFNLKRRLENEIPIGTRFIEYEDYENWCDAEKYYNPDNRRRLLRILNRVGAIVYFDKPVLDKYQILNPEWISTGAYALLTHERTAQTKGQLKWSDLKIIFKDEKEIFSNKAVKIKYNETHFEFILRLMLEYGLCQKSPLNDEYLVPSSFGEQPAKDYHLEMEGGREYRLQFSSNFEMLIMHRFISKNLLNITGKDYWHSGIYFKHASSNTFALITTNLYSKQINCHIKGDNILGMWEVIRNDFREIFKMYHNFEVKEEVKYTTGVKTVYLPYDEMLNALNDGVSVISYHAAHRLRDINVFEVLSLFEPIEQTKNMIKNEGVNINVQVNPTFNNNPVISPVFYNYASDAGIRTELQQLQTTMQGFTEAFAANEAWNQTFVECLEALNEVIISKEKPAEKANKNNLFQKLKDIKDIVAIANLPVDIMHKGPELFTMLSKALQ